MPVQHDAVIVGTGHGGAQAAIALRQHGFAGSIALVGAETDPPYERPPLSKDYLAGEREFERLLIRPAAFWDERQITILLGRRVAAVEPRRHELILGNGETIGYRYLVWAAGGEPRRLGCRGGDLEGVHAIRRRADVDRLRGGLERAERVAVVGGGYIGLEAASILRKLDKRVVLLEAMDRVLSRVAGEPLSRFFETEHRARGVDLRLGASIEGIEADNGRVRGVTLADGSRVEAELVIAAIGIAAVAEPLLAAGAVGGDGVWVDEYCRTSLPDIYAIGDCAAHQNRFAGGDRIRLESVQNAHDQAVVAAMSIVGDPRPYDSLPWFWSSQFDLKLQTVGLFHGHDDLAVRGDPAERSFSIVYLRQGKVIALDCVNAVKDYVQGRALILGGAVPDRRRLADRNIPLKSLIE